MSLLKIVSRWDASKVLFESATAASVAELVKQAAQTRANLYGAYLSEADLSGANLSGVDLSRADLSRADLSEADLSGANLSGVDLSRADLSRADLSGASLSGVNLSEADLYGANLSGANLSEANLSGAKGAELCIARTRILPSEGEVIGWKKCRDNVIVKLRVPPEARRSHAFGRKCRAEWVEVLDVIGAVEGKSHHDGGATVYRKGEVVRPHDWSEDWVDECAPGIHFFITREEAEAY